ncbi:MAG: hypothetical protein R3B52_03455 [Candidatus Paceibacterota bacterium]
MESFENQEILRDQVVAALRSAHEAGATADDFAEKAPEAFRLLGSWIDQEEAKLGASAEDQIRFNAVRAEMLFEAGFVSDAREALLDAAEYARNVGLDDLAKEILEKLNSDGGEYRV